MFDWVIPECSALSPAKVAIATALSVPGSFSIINTGNRTGIVLFSLAPTCRTISTFKVANEMLGFKVTIGPGVLKLTYDNSLVRCRQQY